MSFINGTSGVEGTNGVNGARDVLPLPMVPEEITAEWLGKVLQQKVKSIDITNSILDATASKIFVTITCEDENDSTPKPTYVCLKGGFNPAMLNLEGYSDILKLMYSREVKFFNLVAPKLGNISLPKLWWAGENSVQGQAIVIMEDLSKEHTFGDPVDDWSVDRVRSGLEQLAGLHAGTWGSTVSGENSWLTPAYEHVMIGLTMNWEAMVLGDDRPPIPESIRVRERTVAAMKKHFATKNPKYVAVLHGDPHSGNTFLDKAGKPYFLDWQTNHIGCAFHDVTYFMIGALSVEDRRAHEVELFNHYLQALAKAGGPSLSVEDEELMKEYKKSTMCGMGWILTPYQMQRKDRVWAMCARYTAAMEDHKVIELVESLPEPSEQ